MRNVVSILEVRDASLCLFVCLCMRLRLRLSTLTEIDYGRRRHR